MVQAYLWSRTIICPSCTGLIPLSPNWKLSSKLGLMMVPNQEFKVVQFKVVRLKQMSRGTIAKGIATCPLCGATCPQFYPRDEAQADRLGQVLYCIVFRDWFPIYRSRGGAIQANRRFSSGSPEMSSPRRTESDGAAWHPSGWAEQAMQSDPIYRDYGLFEDPPSKYFAGQAAMERAAQELADAADGWTNPEWRPSASRIKKARSRE